MFIMKNRIRTGNILRTVLSIIIYSALAMVARAEPAVHSRIDKVKILILSKHIRLVKEGKTDTLQIYLPKRGELVTGEKRIPCGTLSVNYSKSNFFIKTGDAVFIRGDIILYPQKNGDTFTITVNGEKRFYPLPLFIKNSGSEIELSVEDKIDRFAVDSAWGELGETSVKHSEALYALAHLIKARCSLPYLKNRHTGYDFCDLTCCQTYKGISGKTFDDPVSINTALIRNGLFFNSSSGGTIFTESIFSSNERKTIPSKDIIYSENLTLSSEKFLNWEASIGERKLSQILYPDKNIFLKNIVFDRDKEIMLIETGNGTVRTAPESFRIKVNRVEGWNFIKSNNYSITRLGGVYKFRGSGLGHGTGMSFEGALQLAERGYSRYEILEHYYPEIQYKNYSEVNHQLQYIIFNSESGETIKSSSASFNNRIVPCGSIFKLFIALYLLEKRPDLFNNYSYTCADSNKVRQKDKVIPEHCWKRSGHGTLSISGALSNSCNKYFASLYSKIDSEDFYRWINDFTGMQGIQLTIPATKNKIEFSNLLAGLNFRMTITIDGIIKLNRYLYMQNKEHTSEEIEIIFTALHKTFTDGTAKETDEDKASKTISSPVNINRKFLWGKTGTVIAGTNSHHGYGIFTGGVNSNGIVSLLRKGTGAMAAKESEKILLNSPPAPLFEKER